MMIQEFFNQSSQEVQSYQFLGRELYHTTSACPGWDVNQDSSAFIEVSKDMGILIVADGMGGLEKGERVSKMAIQKIIEHIKGSSKRESKMSHIILDALDDAHQTIKEHKIQGGTTISLCEVTRDYVRFYNIGDSFGLLLGSRGLIKYRTIDDSITGYGVESGLISEEKALVHENSNIITNALGLDDFRVEVSCKLVPSKYDLIFLSSDGVSANLTTDKIAEVIAQGAYESKLSHISSIARKKMESESSKFSNPDDLTCFLFSYPGVGEFEEL